jgi:hypothetical protein
VIAGREADRVLLAHMGECFERIRGYTAVARARHDD